MDTGSLDTCSKRWQLKEKARELRSQGFSYSEILNEIPVSKSTISLWCRDIPLSAEQLKRLGGLYDQQYRGAKANSLKRKTEVLKIKSDAHKLISKLSSYELLLCGTMLYWAEGSKASATGITNSDPNMIRFMMVWFRDVLGINDKDFRVGLNIHSGQSEDEIRLFWSELTRIPLSQFHKTYIKPEGSGYKKNKLYYGTVKISIYNENVKQKILGLIEKVVIDMDR